MAGITVIQDHLVAQLKGYSPRLRIPSMPILIVGIVLQLFCLVHAIKTGRDRIWIYVIFIGSVVGCAAYLLIEVLPEIMGHRSTRKAVSAVAKTINPTGDLRRAAGELEVSNNLDNVLRFADECIALDRFDDARQALVSARRGLFEHDPQLLVRLGTAQFHLGEHVEAKLTLDQLIEHNPDFKSEDGHLVYARNLEALGNIAGAEHEYRVLADYFPGPQARYWFVCFLMQQGRRGEAQAIISDVLTTAKRAPAFYRKLHQPWLARFKHAAARG